MGINNEQLRRELAALGHECPTAPGGELLLMLKGVDGPLPFLVSSGSKGVIVQFRSVGLLKYGSSPHRRLVEAKVLELNNEYKLAKFAVGGDMVIGFVDLLVADAPCNRGQLERCLMVLKMVIVPCQERLKSVAEKGEDPGKQAVMLRVLKAMAGEGGAPSKKPNSGPKAPKGNGSDAPSGDGDFDDWLKDLIDD